jgi:hypothetical protein
MSSLHGLLEIDMLGSKLDDAWNEIAKGAADLVLSSIQYQIIINRRHLSSYQQRREKYDISSDNAVIKCIVRTAYGFLWTPGNQGGRFGYLSDLGLVQFRKLIVRHATDFDCISHEPSVPAQTKASGICHENFGARALRGHSQSRLDPRNRTCSSWLNEIAHVLGLKICAPQELEAARRHLCDVPAITLFLTTSTGIIYGRDPRLVFNMDETQLSAKKRFRVLTVAGNLPLVKPPSKLPQLTGIVTISAGGACFRPIVILKSLKTLKSLTHFCDHTAFATSLNGWITSDLFVMFTIDFYAQLTFCYMQLPDAIAKHRVLLVLDWYSPERVGNDDLRHIRGRCSHPSRAFYARPPGI